MRRSSSKRLRWFDFGIKWSEKHLKNVYFCVARLQIKNLLMTCQTYCDLIPKNKLNLHHDLYNNLSVTQAFILIILILNTLNIHVHLAGSVCVCFDLQTSPEASIIVWVVSDEANTIWGLP